MVCKHPKSRRKKSLNVVMPRCGPENPLSHLNLSESLCDLGLKVNGWPSGSPKRWDGIGGGIVHPPIGRKNTTYIPLIGLAFWGGYMLPTTF